MSNEQYGQFEFSVSHDDVIALYHKDKPTLLWRIGKDTLPKVRRLQDGMGQFLMGEVTRLSHTEMMLLGHPVEIVEGRDIRLITIGGNRE